MKETIILESSLFSQNDNVCSKRHCLFLFLKNKKVLCEREASINQRKSLNVRTQFNYLTDSFAFELYLSSIRVVSGKTLFKNADQTD